MILLVLDKVEKYLYGQIWICADTKISCKFYLSLWQQLQSRLVVSSLGQPAIHKNNVQDEA